MLLFRTRGADYVLVKATTMFTRKGRLNFLIAYSLLTLRSVVAATWSLRLE